MKQFHLKIFLRLLLMGAILTVVGPEQAKSRVDVGFKMGVNFPTLLGTDTISRSEYFSTESWGPDFPYARGDFELPILAKLYLSPARKLCLVGGPAFAFKYRGTMPVEEPSDSPYSMYPRLKDADIENLKSFDLGLTLGGAMHFGLGRSSFFLELRYTIGLLDIVRHTPSADREEGKAYLDSARNATLSLLVGVSIAVH
jgi:hypothetical protein